MKFRINKRTVFEENENSGNKFNTTLNRNGKSQVGSLCKKPPTEAPQEILTTLKQIYKVSRHRPSDFRGSTPNWSINNKPST